ncbi:MAG: sulfotransferase domain-containing protein [Planctomycetota bacterium]
MNLIHCSYHKCLTVYYKRVMHAVFNRCLPWSGGYRHFNSHIADFYGEFEQLRVASVNNRALDLERLGEFRVSRFVRDPRDLLVSGYFYHRRGAESWTTMEAPSDEDWYFANGVIPEGLRQRGGSYAAYLQSMPEEDGLLVELEFRQRHFESMGLWPTDHPQVRLFRYEEILGDELRVFRELFEFYGLPFAQRRLGQWFARRYSMGRRRKDAHIRNPASGQWRKHFTPRLSAAFEERHPGLIASLGYPAD